MSLVWLKTLKLNIFKKLIKNEHKINRSLQNYIYVYAYVYVYIYIKGTFLTSGYDSCGKNVAY